MKLQYYIAVIAVLVASHAALAAEPTRVPEGIPLLTGEAVAQAADGDALDSEWTIALSLPRETWREIREVLPKMNWPEPKWEKAAPGMRRGTMTLPMGDPSGPVFCRVIDLSGKHVERDGVLELLNEQKPVLVSASGRVPPACYLRLPTHAELVVLLGPGDKKDAGGEPSPDPELDATVPAKAAEDDATKTPEIDLKFWGEPQSWIYYMGMMSKAKTFKFAPGEKPSAYMKGIWRLDKLAHVGGGHYVHADRGDDVTVICTDKWLVKTIFNTKKPGVAESVHRIEKVALDPGGNVKVNDREHFLPIDQNHMAVVDYDFIAVVKRIPCESNAKPQDAEEDRPVPSE